ncbi:unnamed protein product [Tilletia laevis]|uniref:Wax synthase domain-containing protein n=3 Tax=Tilletia TaxID=13289 RepID=A0A8X7MLK7_9BASI|nr:hypothetical protein CF336_g1561 [Tilletia laevis]KAE8202905.1 hypothetical protein CF328_g1946 [Tilletia controversa]KAE8264196.1 hypothetical protein A4X03_0g1121 [Tilletia caries]KAE8207669.1 hypothetical protein CF335_g978 [Tilletia laevis]KAE8241160.1 hypothetical protein A4X06_0g7643 [Tilletia controversa]
MASLFTRKRARSQLLGVPLLYNDPIVELAKRGGFTVTEYNQARYPLVDGAIAFLQLLGFIVGTGALAYFLYHLAAKRNVVAKWVCTVSLISLFLAWPSLTPMSGAMLLDFFKPALGFRSALLVWDVFMLRPLEEVNSWHPFQFFAQLWAFPLELDEVALRTEREGYQRSPRIQNLKRMPTVMIELILLILTLYIVPPYEYTRNMSQLAFHCYSYALGFSILMALAAICDGLLSLMGIIIGVEMADMFENPIGTINIRMFWSHWNRAIASVLHRVIFAGAKSARSQSDRKIMASKALNGSQSAAQALMRRKHLDGLSETEYADTTDDETSHNKNGSATSSGVGSQKNGVARRREKSQLRMSTTASSAEKSKKDASGSSSGASNKKFASKAISAILTFACSGIFHEHITYFTLGFANGENFLFFLINGFATVGTTWFKRTFPEINNKIPTFLAVIMLHSFFLAVAPLFCAPFIRSGFFIQLEALFWEIIPVQSRSRGVFIWLFGQ